jgi:hypothetical protein
MIYQAKELQDNFKAGLTIAGVDEEGNLEWWDFTDKSAGNRLADELGKREYLAEVNYENYLENIHEEKGFPFK